MIPRCTLCLTGVRCQQHSTSGTLITPLVPISTGVVANGQPPKHSAGTAKRKSSGTTGDQPSTSKRMRITSTELPPTLVATSSQPQPSNTPPGEAYDVWNSIRGCLTIQSPPGSDRNTIVQDDTLYQLSKPFTQFRRPDTPRLRCIHCLDGGKWKTWGNREGGLTGRIREHMEKYHLEAFQAAGIRPRTHVEAEIDESELVYSPERFAECLAAWAAVDDQAMNVVESKEFRRLMLMASRAPSKLHDVDIPHRKKVAQTAYDLYVAEKERIKVELQNALGRISITSDLWSDDVLRAFMAMTVHYINSKGELAEHLIAFRRIQGHHTGANIGQTLFSVLEEAGITHKIGHITLDNASANDTLMKELEDVFTERGFVFGRDLNRIRCFPHVINLAVNAILKALPEAAQRFREENAAQGYDLDPDISAYLDALESGIIAACRDSIRSMRSSDVRREEFRTTIQDGNSYGLFKTKYGEILILPVLQLLRDSETRWSSTYNMIMRYLELYPAVLHYSYSHPDLKIPVVSHKQFEVLQDIVSVLSVLHNAQELLSAERTPTLALALPVYETLIQALKDLTYKFPELQHAIECGVRKLEAYVAKTRDLPVYAYAMAVNPCLKFTWIDDHWSPLQRQQARVVVKEKMFEICQKKHNASKPSTSSSFGTSTPAERASRAQHSGYMRLLTITKGISRASDLAGSKESSINPESFDAPSPSLPVPPLPTEDELLARHMAEVDAELHRWEQLIGFEYTTMGTVNLVDFWKARRYEFPLLYEIAMSVLPVQASSVSSERAFSSSKLTCTRERNNISAETMECLQVLKHALHRRRSTPDNHQTLDFMAHVVGSDVDDENED